MHYYCLFLAASVLAAQTGPGQIEGLAATHDGSILYFSSQLRIRSTSQSEAYKIFAADRSGIRLAVEETGGIAIDRRNPSVSADGKVLAYSTRLKCAQCQWLPVTSIVTGVPGQPDLSIQGIVEMSADGRRAMIQTSSGAWEWMDLATGERHPLTSFSNGFERGGKLVLFEVPYFDPLPGAPGQNPAPGWYYLDKDGKSVKLPGHSPSLSTDGNRILAVPDHTSGLRGAVLVDRLSGKTTHYSMWNGQTEKVLISGDGKVGYALNGWGVYRVSLEEGVVEPWALYPARSSVWGIVPGSYAEVAMDAPATARPVRAETPLPKELAGFRVRLNGQAAMMHSVRLAPPSEPALYAPGSTIIAFQTPWEFRAPSGEVLVDVEAPRAPFEYVSRYPSERVQERIRGFAMRSAAFLLLDPPQFFPGFIQFNMPALLALHEDETTFIDTDHPARKGEVIHAYMTGLGAVDQEVRDGEPAGGDPPARLVQPIACEGTETVDAKLAQGLIGIYRVSLRLLMGAPKGTRHMVLFCDGMIGNRVALPLLTGE